MHGGDIYRNNIQFDFSVNINPMGVPQEVQWVLTEAALHANKYPDIYLTIGYHPSEALKTSKNDLNELKKQLKIATLKGSNYMIC